MKKKTTVLALSILSIFSFSVSTYATEQDEHQIKKEFSSLIKGSYIVTFKESTPEQPSLVKVSTKNNRGKYKAAFGEHSTNQSKVDLANQINLRGEITSILDRMNAIVVKMDEKEALRLSKDERVLSIEQDSLAVSLSTQLDPGWALDRLDEQSATLDSSYNYTFTGAGRTIYVLDTGLNLDDPEVNAEFGGRASVIWDVNGDTGEDCRGHGTRVSSAAAGSTYGVAKGATIIMAKVTTECTGSGATSTLVLALNWLTSNAPVGTIVNMSRGFTLWDCSTPFFSPALETAVENAHDAGIIVVVAAGNDGCDTMDYSPANIPESFVVGATSNLLIPGSDGKADMPLFPAASSRVGTNISTFAPGEELLLMDEFGNTAIDDITGTSYSAPYISGIFAVACEAAGTLCDTVSTAAPLYEALRNTGTLGTVTDTDGSPIPNSTSRFISQQW